MRLTKHIAAPAALVVVGVLLSGCATHFMREVRHEWGQPAIRSAILSSSGTAIEINNHVIEWLWAHTFGRNK